MIIVFSRGWVEGIMKEGEWDGVVADTSWVDGEILVNKGTCGGDNDGAASAAEEEVGKEG
jgi:hypothetical protein